MSRGVPADGLAAALADRYRLDREIGSGGMATVYLAHDLKHDRDVAIKVLLPELAASLGAERFLAEIKTTARLQHPHILPLLDSGGDGGVLYYVMPWVAGESLRDRLTREKQLPVEDALRIAREVADALGHAHAHGIIHRDVKPENILLQGGHALVADFGIALAVQSAGGQRMTQTGLSLGTPQYMSPEQALGEKAIDARADVYALGAVTYEMLTGEPPFTGASAQAVVAKVISAEPERPTLLRTTVPPHVERVVLLALAKLPADRIQSTMDFAAGLQAGPPGTGQHADAPMRASRERPWLRDRRTQALLGVGGLLLLLNLPGARADTDDLLRLTIAPPQGFSFDAVNWASAAITPDGRRVVFAARGPSGSKLFVRDMDDFEARALQGTDGAAPAVAISPDGRWVAFRTARMEVRKVALAGSTGAASLGSVTDWFGQQPIWLGDSMVVMLQRRDLWAFSADGSGARRVASLDTARGERAFNSGVALPDGRMLVAVETDSGMRAVVIEWDGLHRDVVGELGSIQSFVPPDRVMTQRAGQVLLVRLDLESYRAVGEPIPILPGAATSRVSTSARGDAAYFQVQWGKGQRLVWVDRRGATTPLAVEPGEYRSPRLSPDGRRVVLFGRTERTPFATTVIDLASGGRINLSGLSWTANPLWDRMGQNILVAAELEVPQQVFSQSADGIGDARVAYRTPKRSAPYSVTTDDALLGETLGETIDIVLAERDGRSRVVVGGPAAQRMPMMSPDGRWLAYQSSEGERFEIYVQPWPALDRKWAISTEGGSEPVWSRDGKELYFRNASAMMMSRITTTPEFSASRPVLLFDALRFGSDPMGDPSFDVGIDGRFLMVEDDPSARVELRVERNALKVRR